MYMCARFFMQSGQMSECIKHGVENTRAETEKISFNCKWWSRKISLEG